MTEKQPEAARSAPIVELDTTLGRPRCPQPAQLSRMRQSLSVGDDYSQECVYRWRERSAHADSR